MTRAEQAKFALTQCRMTWNEALNEASTISEAYEQDYDQETTWFEYPDGSVGVFLGQTQEILSYGCRS